MKSFWMFVAVTLNQCLCFSIKSQEHRSRRSSDNAEKIDVGFYNEYIESKRAEKCFPLSWQLVLHYNYEVLSVA